MTNFAWTMLNPAANTITVGTSPDSNLAVQYASSYPSPTLPLTTGLVSVQGGKFFINSGGQNTYYRLFSNEDIISDNQVQPMGTGYTVNQTPAEKGTTGANASITAVLPAQSGFTNYVSGIKITGGGATAASLITATLTGLTNTLSYVIAVPAGATLGIVPLVVEFDPPLPASAANTAITLTVPAAGTGNTAMSAVIHGF